MRRRARIIHLLPWSRAGLAVGALMFAAHATGMAENPAFRLELIPIAAGLNAAVFHWGVFCSVEGWDAGVPVPAAARGSAIASLVLWTAVIACGRLLAYL
jgi:hypothetical protein